MTTRPLYQVIAQTLEAALRCSETKNIEWLGHHELRLTLLVKEYMPSGSGIDAGTSFMVGKQKRGELRFLTSFHHMDANGFYREWTGHEVIVTPDLAHGFNVKITGPDKNGIKEYLGEVFYSALSQEIDSNAMMEAAHA